MTHLPNDPDVPDPEGVTTEEDDDGPDSVLDRLRGTGVGVEDPNIVGDAGPTDVAPGRDPGGGGLLVVDEEPAADGPPPMT